jgi:hypothetical protein
MFIIHQQSCTIKSLETKAEILEKQLDEMKNKESSYVDQKTKFRELEQKYLQCIHQLNAKQTCLGNTPPLSQHAGPFCDYQIPPLHHNDSAGIQTSFSNKAPSTDFGLNLYQTRKPNDYYSTAESNPLLYDPMFYPNLSLNPMIISALPGNVKPLPPTVDSNVSHSNINTSNPSYCTALALPRDNTITSSLGSQNSLHCRTQSYSTPNSSAVLSTDCSKVHNTGTYVSL